MLTQLHDLQCIKHIWNTYVEQRHDDENDNRRVSLLINLVYQTAGALLFLETKLILSRHQVSHY